MSTLLAAIAAGFAAAAQPPAAAPTPPAGAAPLDWRSLEAPLLTGHVQLSTRERFSRAGESYFDHQTPPRWIVFQATEAPKPGEEPSPFYGMYIAKLRVDDAGAVTGMDLPVLISRPGSANTCGWFDPVNVGNVLFGSTVEPPSEENQPGFQRGTGRYRWEFPREMKIVNRVPLLLLQDMKPALETADLPATVFNETVILGGDAYHAECSYSPDGRFILYTRMMDPAKRELHIFVFDTVLKTERPLITAPGYNGGPFFSYDGKRICFRSDRKGDSLLQLFIADLKFERDASGIDVPVGITAEHQITDDGNVNWAPFWHPSGKAIVYASSAVSHRNYEVFAIETDTSKPREQLRKRRITFADGFDGLPAFSDDGRVLMWTSQRGPKIEGEERPSSQIWTATVDPAVWSDPDRLFNVAEPATLTPPTPASAPAPASAPEARP
jgi:TolB protein